MNAWSSLSKDTPKKSIEQVVSSKQEKIQKSQWKKIKLFARKFQDLQTVTSKTPKNGVQMTMILASRC
ncbi:hypothetical protein PR048_020046 [Dryococelus australis]|uniref:Uncharacterized protein n=1 Tax=Dryococelus australis TaxID=614101 RepID=A0ABQ9H570_9NEOP|nr:hypothetical protein PR048_020046 [Dryococelus australis]